MSTETREFRAEMKQLMDIIIHSLYSHKEIFLRELISNAADAIDKIRFQSLTNQALLEGNAEWKIKIHADKQRGTLTISDNGIGMSRETVAEDLGTIARSGTRAFLETLKEAKSQTLPELIGQFGVGFYSSFMVADAVTVVTRAAGDKARGVKWESQGHGTFTIEDVEKETRGTDVILHLKTSEHEFLDEWRLRQVVKKFSDFIEHPIVMDVEHEDDKKEKTTQEETLNSRQAIWLRSKDDVTPEQYHEFYKHIAHDFEDPLKIINYAAEGVMEFRALMFVPARRPFDLFMPEAKRGMHLYIRRVFIMDDCKALMPDYLRFVKGVVDAADLPLNVSREMLQHSPRLEKIRRNLTGKVLDALAEMKEKEGESYEKFYGEFGPVLKEGIHSDAANKEKLSDLLLFASTKTEGAKRVALKDYVEAMPSDQNEIYYLIGDDPADVRRSPHLEVFKSRGHEVLLMTDPIDEWVVQALTEYRGKKLKAADRGEIEPGKAEKAKIEENETAFKDLLGFLRGKIEEVKDVRLSTRLTDSAACLVSEEGGPGAHMERLMRELGREADLPPVKRILELNANHAVVRALRELYARDASDARLESYGRLLYDEAVMAEGTRPTDPVAFARRVNDLLLRDLAGTPPAAAALNPAGDDAKSKKPSRKKKS